MAEHRHVPVLVETVLDLLAPERGGVYVDATVGLGGHAEALLERAPDACLIGLDRDPYALDQCGRRLERFGARVRLVHGRFSDLGSLLATVDETWSVEQWPHAPRVAGILADLGVSSMQLDAGERGFAFAHDAPLDMRMDPTSDPLPTGGPAVTARTIVNREPEEVLTTILKQYGEERHARRISRAIVRERLEKPIETTAELAALVERVKPMPPGPRRRHPATQTFQALRIEVNREIEEIETLVDEAAGLLEPGGRMAIISYHSLEDRVVKNGLRDLARGLIDPVTGQTQAETRMLEVLTKKPIRPSGEEVARNPRARSARLRAGRRI